MPPVRTYHHGNLRAALLDCAEQTLAAGGELSLRELARKVGVSHGAPRRHFVDKQELLDALALDGFQRLGAATRRRARRARTRCASGRCTYVRFATEHAALLDLMFTGKHASPELNAASDRCFSPAMALFESELTGMVAFATLHGLAALINRGLLRAEDLDALVDEAVEQMAARSVGG